MAFQRSYSKVWWGSDDTVLVDVTNGIRIKNHAPQSVIKKKKHIVSNSNIGVACNVNEPKTRRQQKTTFDLTQQPVYHTLTYKCFGGNLSCIQEVENETNSPKLTWSKHNSPRSLRSLDSGFSDNEEYLSGRSSKPVSPNRHSLRSTKSDIISPPSIASATTPTVIPLTGRSKFYAPLVNVSRHIFFNTPRSNNSSYIENMDTEMNCKAEGVLKNINLNSSSTYDPKRLKNSTDNEMGENTNKFSASSVLFESFARKKEISDANLRDLSSQFKEYNNETVHLGVCAPKDLTLSIPPYNNETVLLGRTLMESAQHTNTLSPLCLSQNSFECKTSTPKMKRKPSHLPIALMNDQTFLNVAPPVQRWLNDLHLCYEHEVMSTLQTKSIVQEAFKNLTITTNVVAKLIRQLQQKALHMQSSFERVERLIIDAEQRSLSEALNSSIQLIEEVEEFSQILQRRGVFFADSRFDHKQYEAHLYQIRLVAKDTRYSVEHQHYINMESLLEDIQVLKRNILITLRQVYVKLLRILVQSIEHNCQGGNDLMLRANINMIATIMNIDYDGFASLTNAFVQTEAVRTLLAVCVDHRLSSVRAMALRALATVCSTSEPIAQLSSCGGIEIIRDILQLRNFKGMDSSLKAKRSEIEKREAVSLLTQITAHWHGPNHRVNGLRICLESLIEGVTDLVSRTECPETLLLCAAALNNLSRMEITAHYSIMSHETIFKLVEATKVQSKTDIDEQGVSIFLYDQIVAMLQNMSQNRKCHSHLANAKIINFITHVYQAEFYKSYSSRGEKEAQRRTIKCILHTLVRLTQDSVMGMELLEQQKHMPCAVMSSQNVAGTISMSDRDQQQQEQNSILDNNNYCISALAHQLLQKQKQVQGQYQHQRQQKMQQQPQQQQQQQNQQRLQQQQQESQQQHLRGESMKDSGNVNELNMQLARQESYV